MVVTYCFKDIIIINVIIIIYLSYISLKKSKSICLPEIRTCTIGLGYFGQ